MSWNIELPDVTDLSLHPERLESVIREASDAFVIGIDTETTGLVNFKERVLGWSVAFNNTRAVLTPEQLCHWQPLFKNPNKHWALANAKFDMHMLANMGYPLEGKCMDTQVMDSLIDEREPHGLKQMSKKWLDWTWQGFEDIVGKISKANPPERAFMKAWTEHHELAAQYMACDAWGTLQLFQRLHDVCKREKTTSWFPDHGPCIQNMWDLFYNVEMPFTRTLWTVERNGILTDTAALDAAAPIAEREIDQLERDIWKTVGFNLKVSSPKALAEYFFDYLGLEPVEFTKGGQSGIKSPKMDEKTLQTLAEEHPVAEMVLEHRNKSKLLGTYIHGLQEWRDSYGRIHSTLKQIDVRCMPAGELVLTSRGYLPVEQVQEGDQVITHRGRTKRVTGTSVHAPSCIYKTTLTNGLVLRTNSKHPYWTGDSWVNARDLTVGSLVAVHSDPEAWKKVPDWTDFSVSTWGRVRNDKTGRMLTQYPKGRWGHLKVCLYRNGAQKRGEDRADFAVHRLVLLAWRGDSRLEVRHLDGVAWDNTLQNLMYGTSGENTQDARRHGTISLRRLGKTILTQEQVTDIRAAKVRRADQALSRAKLSREQVAALRAAYTGVFGQKAALAKKYGVTQAAVGYILKGAVWNKPHETEGSTVNELATQYGVSASTIKDIRTGRVWKPDETEDAPPVKFYFARVMYVEVEERLEATYGLTVEEDCSHVTGGIVTHNTGRLASKDPNLRH